MFKEIEPPKKFFTEDGTFINIERTLKCEECNLVFQIDGNDKVLGLYSS